MNQTKGRCQDTSSLHTYSIVVFMYNCPVLYNAPWIEALSLRTVARGKQYRDVRKQTTNKQLLNFTGGREGGRGMQKDCQDLPFKYGCVTSQEPPFEDD